MEQALRSLDVEILGTLGAADLARLVRGQFDPTSTDALDSDGAELSLIAAGPMTAAGHWDHYRSGSGVHAVYWIAEWPSMPVEAAWFCPLLPIGGGQHTVTVTCEPIQPSRRCASCAASVWAKRADEAQRPPTVQIETAQEDEEYDALERPVRELVCGATPNTGSPAGLP